MVGGGIRKGLLSFYKRHFVLFLHMHVRMHSHTRRGVPVE